MAGLRPLVYFAVLVIPTAVALASFDQPLHPLTHLLIAVGGLPIVAVIEHAIARRRSRPADRGDGR